MMAANDDVDMADEDTLRILVATDTHLGYMEHDPIRGRDSFKSFEEVLNIAVKEEVDMLLLGGDLFHENKPSRKCLHQCIKALRTHCMGDRPVNFNIVSDQTANFPGLTRNHPGQVNYEDRNLNISLPVFTIHGNHDDPTSAGLGHEGGGGSLCAVDLLSAMGLVNYFGKAKAVDDITINPILFEKGKIRLALYGLGAVRDERLYHSMVRKQVKFLKPPDPDDGNDEKWFSAFVLHQNRVKHGKTNYVPESFLPSFLDLVIWGHEHECRISMQENCVESSEDHSFYIMQPGSSVATSLCDGEAAKKHVALLTLRSGGLFKCDAIPLRTVRPFRIDEVKLCDESVDVTNREEVEEMLMEKVQHLIDSCAHICEETRMKPLIRIKVDTSGYNSVINAQQFGQKFTGKVANPREILLLTRRKIPSRLSKRLGDHAAVDTGSIVRPDKMDDLKVSMLVSSFMQIDKALDVLGQDRLNEAVDEFVEKEEKDAIMDTVESMIKEYICRVKDRSNHLEGENIEDILTSIQEEDRRKRETANEQQLNKTKDKIDSDKGDLEKDADIKSSTKTAAKRKRNRGTSSDDSDAGHTQKSSRKTIADYTNFSDSDVGNAAGGISSLMTTVPFSNSEDDTGLTPATAPVRKRKSISGASKNTTCGDGQAPPIRRSRRETTNRSRNTCIDSDNENSSAEDRNYNPHGTFRPPTPTSTSKRTTLVKASRRPAPRESQPGTNQLINISDEGSDEYAPSPKKTSAKRTKKLPF